MRRPSSSAATIVCTCSSTTPVRSTAKRRLTADGVELTWALNHLAPFLLTDLLLDALVGSAPARVVTVSSDAARQGVIDLGDLQGAGRRFRPMAVYGDTKLANILFTFELARRLRGTGVTATCLHPGFVRTRWGNGLSPAFRAGIRVAHVVARTPEKGAETVVYLAASPEAESHDGLFFHDLRPVTAPPAAYDEHLAADLWQESGRLTGISGDHVGDAERPGGAGAASAKTTKGGTAVTHPSFSILGLAGSLRRESYNRALLRAPRDSRRPA